MISGSTKAATIWNSVTPSDSTEVGFRALWINTGGVVALEDNNGNVEQFTVLDSTLLPVQPVKVLSTNTTASGILGLN